MFKLRNMWKYYIFHLLPPDFQLIETHSRQILIKIRMVLVAKVNLAFILSIAVSYSLLQVKKNIFVKKNIKNILFFVILFPDLSL